MGSTRSKMNDVCSSGSNQIKMKANLQNDDKKKNSKMKTEMTVGGKAISLISSGSHRSNIPNQDIPEEDNSIVRTQQDQQS